MSVVIICSAALFGSALLLFLVQPMFAKMVLPLLRFAGHPGTREHVRRRRAKVVPQRRR